MNADARCTDPENDPVHLAAAEWLVRLQDPRFPLEDALAWQDWMKADRRHVEVFSQLEEISGVAGLLRIAEKSSVGELARDRYDGSVTVSQWLGVTQRRRGWAIAASVLLVACTVLGILSAANRTLYARVLTTEVGENRTVPLEDGSRIILGGNSQVQVEMSRSVRAVDLQRGEAFFSVAKDSARPFKVRAGGTRITALGTEFNVRRESDRILVAVTEGRVLVEPVSPIIPIALWREFKPKLRPVRVAAGEETFAGNAGIEAASKQEDLLAATSWQTGRLEFQQQPLKYVLQDVNRYAPKPIVPEDADIGALIITGTVTRDSTADWISSLEQAFSLKAIDEPDRILLRHAP